MSGIVLSVELLHPHRSRQVPRGRASRRRGRYHVVIPSKLGSSTGGIPRGAR